MRVFSTTPLATIRPQNHGSPFARVIMGSIRWIQTKHELITRLPMFVTSQDRIAATRPRLSSLQKPYSPFGPPPVEPVSSFGMRAPPPVEPVEPLPVEPFGPPPVEPACARCEVS